MNINKNAKNILKTKTKTPQLTIAITIPKVPKLFIPKMPTSLQQTNMPPPRTPQRTPQPSQLRLPQKTNTSHYQQQQPHQQQNLHKNASNNVNINSYFIAKKDDIPLSNDIPEIIYTEAQKRRRSQEELIREVIKKSTLELAKITRDEPQICANTLINAKTPVFKLVTKTVPLLSYKLSYYQNVPPDSCCHLCYSQLGCDYTNIYCYMRKNEIMYDYCYIKFILCNKCDLKYKEYLKENIELNRLFGKIINNLTFQGEDVNEIVYHLRNKFCNFIPIEKIRM